MSREELEKAYNGYIEELAKDALENKPVNKQLLQIVAKVQADIRNLDIVAAMKRQREMVNCENEEISPSRHK